jgi:hypothetical protein
VVQPLLERPGDTLVNRPKPIRERVLTRVIDMLQHLSLQISMYHPDEREVLNVVERPQQYDLAVDLTNWLMQRLGDDSAPSEPKFDKTRRAMNQMRDKPPRGLKHAGEPTDADAAQAPPTKLY